MTPDLFCRMMSDFVERLKELMFDNQTDAKKLAKAIGASPSTVYSYLEKLYLPRTPRLVRIADYFNCSLDFLLGLKEQNETRTFRTCPPFPERIPVLLEVCGVTKYRFCRDIEISDSLMYYWQVGQKLPSPEHLYTIAKKYNCSVDFILGREN